MSIVEIRIKGNEIVVKRPPGVSILFKTDNPDHVLDTIEIEDSDVPASIETD